MAQLLLYCINAKHKDNNVFIEYHNNTAKNKPIVAGQQEQIQMLYNRYTCCIMMQRSVEILHISEAIQAIEARKVYIKPCYYSLVR